MKPALFLAAFIALGLGAFAQTASDPSEDYVLQKARERYAAEHGSAASENRPASAPAAGGYNEAEGRDAPFYPFLIEVIPGISGIFGDFDVGIQLGAVTASARKVQGFQIAGVSAHARSVEGFQAAGGFATSDTGVEGFQGAGVFATANGTVQGFQGAGVFATVQGALDGYQGAGVFATASGGVSGVQHAGVFCVSGGDVDGLQLAGVFTIAEGDLAGVQVAPIYNQARKVEGLQIGLVNVAEDVEDGMQIGLINIARFGVNGILGYYEPAVDELGFAWQNGSRHFYSVFRASAPRGDWGRSADHAACAFGLGTRLGGRRGEPYLDLELSAAYAAGPLINHFIDCAREGAWSRPSLTGLPYPSARVALGTPLFGRLQLVGGAFIDFDLLDAPALPERFKTGAAWSDNWLGLGFTAYTRWFIGLRM